MAINQNKYTFKDFEQHCKDIQKSTTIVPDEPYGEKKARIERAKKDYQYFFEYYFPMYATAKTAKFHIKFAKELIKDKQFRGIFEAHRGAAKSVHCDLGYPLWLKINGLMKCMLLVGQNETKARRLLASVQAQLSSNRRFINDFGEQFSFGDWAEGEFTTKDGSTFFAIGKGQSPNGTRKDEYRPDVIVVDDVDSKEECRNPRRVKESVEWIHEDLMGCFDIGNERFIICNSRISHQGILATLHKENVKERTKGKWFYIQINALDEKGNPTWPEKYTREYWERKRDEMTLRAWLANYMNDPIEVGKIFKEEWIKWKKMLPLNQYEVLIAYGDPSFKNTANSDTKAIKLWGKYKKEFHLIKCFTRRCSLNTMVQWFYDLHESLEDNETVEYWIEANMLQDLLLDEFETEGDVRNYQLPIRGDTRAKGDKFARIESMSPMYERGFVYYNEDLRTDQDMIDGKQQLLAIEKGSNAPDDSPDADEGAWHIIGKRSRASNNIQIIGQRHHHQSY